MSGFFAKRGLQKLGIDPGEITHVFLTHTDYDHVGGIDLFENAEVYISEAEEQMIDGTTSRFLGLRHNTLDRDYNLLIHGEKIEVGGISVKGFIIPGHTPGSMSYLINGCELFTGDTVALWRNKIRPFWRLQNMNHERLTEMVDTMFVELEGIAGIYTGHTGCSREIDKLGGWKRASEKR